MTWLEELVFEGLMHGTNRLVGLLVPLAFTSENCAFVFAEHLFLRQLILLGSTSSLYHIDDRRRPARIPVVDRNYCLASLQRRDLATANSRNRWNKRM